MSEPAKAEGSVEIFCSYSHKDELLRQEFDSSIALLRRQKLVQIWHDRKISAGDEWAGDIDHHLDSADIVTLFVSADFLASDYCYEKELGRALDREAQKEVVIVPIILRECDWEEAPFGRFQAIPTGAKPVTAWADRDQAWTQVAKSLKGTVRQVLARKMEKIRIELDVAADSERAQALYSQIAQDAQAQRTERVRIMADLQTKIFEITQEIGPILPKPKKTAGSAFKNLEKYIRDE